METELFHAYRWTDGRDEANSRFSNFANAHLKLSMSENSLGWLVDGVKYPRLAPRILRNSCKKKGPNNLE